MRYNIHLIEVYLRTSYFMSV